jgi:large subunit ribosomal protein L4
MATIKKINLAGEQTGDVSVSDALASFPCNHTVVHAAIVAHRAAQRRGTASTLTKGTVDATGRKPWPQKGTGRARAGYRSSPLWRKGGVVFGPQPRSYDKKINRKERRTAFYGLLAERIRTGVVRVIESWQMETPKTKTIAALRTTLGMRSMLCLASGECTTALKSARNVPDVTFLDVNAVGVYELATHTGLVIALDAWQRLEERFSAAGADAT